MWWYYSYAQLNMMQNKKLQSIYKQAKKEYCKTNKQR
jgi:hypothetical protein